jgi:hypothetical protein
MIEDPVGVEITIAGKLKFIVVIDAEDNPEDFAKALSNVTGKSVDFNVSEDF